MTHGYLRAKNSAKWDKSVKYRIIRVRFLTRGLRSKELPNGTVAILMTRWS